MKTYIATFVPGCQDIILRQLKKFLAQQLKILYFDESLAVFTSVFPVERIIEFRFFTNTFLLVRDSKFTFLKDYLRGSTFRIVASEEGEPAKINRKILQELNDAISSQLGIKQSAHRPKNEFWLIKRASGKTFFAFRLARSKHKRRKRPAGELRPELANILLIVAGVKPKDKMLDPFAGYGSIAREAIHGFGVKRPLAYDIDSKLVRRLQREGISAEIGNARKLGIADESIDRVVTDPPWGSYDKSINDLKSIYEGSLKEIHRVLKPGGVAEVLSGNRDLDACIETSRFNILKSYPILVSGKKATIFKLQK